MDPRLPLTGLTGSSSRQASGEGQAEDTIQIFGIRGYGYTGYFPEEQTLGQWFEVDLVLWLDLSPSGASDDLQQTLNYADVVARVTHLVETSRVLTIERLNTLILDGVLAFPQVRQAHSRLVKVAAPIPGFDGRIAVAMTRSRVCSP